MIGKQCNYRMWALKKHEHYHTPCTLSQIVGILCAFPTTIIGHIINYGHIVHQNALAPHGHVALILPIELNEKYSSCCTWSKPPSHFNLLAFCKI